MLKLINWLQNKRLRCRASLIASFEGGHDDHSLPPAPRPLVHSPSQDNLLFGKEAQKGLVERLLGLEMGKMADIVASNRQRRWAAVGQ